MRVISTTFRNNIEASQSGEVAILFATITHPALEAPITVNSDIVDYLYNGVTYTGTGFHMSLLTDDDNPPTAKAAIPNVDRIIGEAILAANSISPPRLKIEVFAKSDFTDAIPRVAIGTPTVQFSAPELFMRNFAVDAISISADIFSYDLSTEPWPSVRSTKDRLPGLYR